MTWTNQVLCKTPILTKVYQSIINNFNNFRNKIKMDYKLAKKTVFSTESVGGTGKLSFFEMLRKINSGKQK